MDQKAGTVQVVDRVGQAMGHGLEPADRHAEGLALLDVGHRHAVRFAGQPDQASRKEYLPVTDGQLEHRVGLRAGDQLLAVDGEPLANGSEFVAAVSRSAGRDISIELERAGEHLRIIASVPEVREQGRAIGRLGITVEEGARTWPPGLIELRRSGPLEAVAVGVAKTWEMSALTVEMLWRMASGQVSSKNISGPISIAEFASVSAFLGVGAYLGFLAIISVSLGVLNLVPVPLLDGGQVLYQLVEAVKGSPLSERAQLYGQQVGIALLVVLMSLAFYNDISRHLN